ncbi:dienelactone hydrolase family protein [Flavobacterium gawalongense]|uniref:Dienelactone hydrolase family protein n=1 Tax=Flavobacterium gawalongense TaxID=2594432 RepID=A0ABY3CKD2_9FLAO|nr:dienelactone hydrolase family protein [Flavobacterium gawalongense]TRX00287.1 dienelactone hydrolase family protein [Flavobacterium gawalongense]TRX05404.1 dienelactone hydrolase family protein [Flavobacterium gawalongense]
MKNIALFILGIVLFSNGTFAQLKPVKYSDGTQVLNGFQIQPIKKSLQKPGILILPAWKGIDNHSKNTSENLAKLGYYVFVADIYGAGNYPKDNAEAGQKAGFYKTNFAAYQKRIALALEQLIKSGANKDNIVVIGFCFGGTGALEAARGNLNIKGVVSFHGGLGKEVSRTAQPITAKVLACHGADDPFVPKEEVTAFQQEMRDSKADWQMVYYANAVHSFTDPESGNDNSKGAAYNEKAAKRSFEHLKIFLNEVLKK